MMQVVRIHVDEEGKYSEVRQDGSVRELAPSKITLNDCLACRSFPIAPIKPSDRIFSGCVTTAETVLIEAQGTAEFYRHLGTHEIVAVTISPPSLASLAAHFQLSLESTFSRLTALFISLGVQFVFDESYARDIALIEAAREFVERKKAADKLPLLASACPGFICYAEKTHGDFLLPHIATTKSPQQAPSFTSIRLLIFFISHSH